MDDRASRAYTGERCFAAAPEGMVTEAELELVVKPETVFEACIEK